MDQMTNLDYIKILQKRKIDTEYSSLDDGSMNNIYRQLTATDNQATNSDTKTTFGH